MVNQPHFSQFKIEANPYRIIHRRTIFPQFNLPPAVCDGLRTCAAAVRKAENIGKTRKKPARINI